MIEITISAVKTLSGAEDSGDQNNIFCFAAGREVEEAEVGEMVGVLGGEDERA